MAAKKKSAKGKANKAVKKAAKPLKSASKSAKKAVKAAPKKVSPIPSERSNVCTGMNLPDTRAAIAFCKKVFGAKVRNEMAAPGGKIMHVEIQIGNTTLMAGDAVRDPVHTGRFMIYVKDCDKTYAAALAAGATSKQPPTNMFWGDRHARVEDSNGNQWGISTRIEKVSPAAMKKRAAEFMAQQAAAAAAAAQPAAAGPSADVVTA